MIGVDESMASIIYRLFSEKNSKKNGESRAPDSTLK